MKHETYTKIGLRVKQEIKEILTHKTANNGFGQRARGGYIVYQFGVDFGYRTRMEEKSGRMMPVREVVLEERESSVQELTTAF